MTAFEIAAVLAAGFAAGMINVAVGSGTLITFPVLVAVGFPPVTANVSNSLGLVPGSVAGVVGYREELKGQRRRLRMLAPWSALGAVVGAVALHVLPDDAFEAIVAPIILLALVLVVAQPWLTARLASRRADTEHGGAPLAAGVFATGVYGGYFGAAQGIILLSLMGVTLPDDLQRINAVKNALAGMVNLIAGLVFLVVADVAWDAVALVAAGSVVGGTIGARWSRQLPPSALRGLIVVVGLSAVAQLWF
jgi:uncharacterized membrane protein YfcA